MYIYVRQVRKEIGSEKEIDDHSNKTEGEKRKAVSNHEILDTSAAITTRQWDRPAHSRLSLSRCFALISLLPLYISSTPFLLCQRHLA